MEIFTKSNYTLNVWLSSESLFSCTDDLSISLVEVVEEEINTVYEKGMKNP